jgi:5-methylthioribose kinase
MACSRVTYSLRLNEENLPDYLKSVGFLPQSQEIRIESAGHGNINWVRRIRCHPAGGSWVVKQARPALERFPEYRVSTERLVFEARYLETARAFDATGVLVGVEFFDPDSRVLILEDLVGCPRLTMILAEGQTGLSQARDCARALGAFLGAVHAGTRDPVLTERFANQEMQRLHGNHIFVLPFRDNAFPLSPALAERARRLRDDRSLVATIDAAHARYLEPVGALVHGDVQPDNVLIGERGPKLLDAEIAHVGDPAFDMGTFLAHLLLPSLAAGKPERAAACLDSAWSAYSEAHGSEALADFARVARYAGIELLRRTLGAARIDAVARDEAGLAVVDAGVRLVTTPPQSPAGMLS